MRYEKLRAWRKQVAAQRGVEPDVIVSNAVLMELAQRRPRTFEQLPTLPWFGPWRRQTYGPALIEVSEASLVHCARPIPASSDYDPLHIA